MIWYTRHLGYQLRFYNVDHTIFSHLFFINVKFAKLNYLSDVVFQSILESIIDINCPSEWNERVTLVSARSLNAVKNNKKVENIFKKICSTCKNVTETITNNLNEHKTKHNDKRKIQINIMINGKTLITFKLS
jgi:hypothetical protein